MGRRFLSMMLSIVLLLGIATASPGFSHTAHAATVSYEAENGTINQGFVDTIHAGYSGTGFVDVTNTVGSYLELNVSASQAGSHSLDVRYASGSGTNRHMTLSVNGTVQDASLDFPGTGAWTTWSNVSVTVQLNAGMNTIRLTSNIAEGGPNLDKLELTSLLSGALIPGRIQAEDYDAMSGIQTQETTDTGGGLNVGYLHAGDWMDYEVNVQAAGTYSIDYRIATPNTGRQFQLKLGSTVLHTTTVPNTGNFQNWQTITEVVTLPAGSQTLRIEAVSDGINFNWIDFTLQSSWAPIPGRIQAEDYDAMSGIQTQETTDTGGGLNVGYLHAGDWMDYEVNVQAAGTYSIDYRIATPNTGRQFQLKLGSTVLHTTTVPNTGNFQSWQTITEVVTLPAGSQTLRIEAVSDGINFNWIDFTLGSVTQVDIKLGNDTVMGGGQTNNSGLFNANRITLTQVARIKSLSLYIASGTGNARLALYSDDSGKPGTLVAQTDAFAATNGWNTADVNWQVSLTPGDYWIGFQTSTNTLEARYSATGGVSTSHPQSYTGGMRFTYKLITGRVDGTKRYSLYATLTPPTQVVPVIPDLKGFGVETQGGRYGQIIKVTNLNASGPGSLKAAIDTQGPRIVVFEVSGNIELTSSIRIWNPYLTIAGQTAPSPGITLKGAGLHVKTHDVVIQHLRLRPGDLSAGDSYHDRDGIQMTGDDQVNNIVLDHLSVSWSVDELMSIYRVYDSDDDPVKRKFPRNITIANTLLSEALYDSHNPSGAHAMGLFMGYDSKNISVINNITAHTDHRAPALVHGVKAYVANNLFYNNRNNDSLLYGETNTPSPILASFIGNHWKPGNPNPTQYPYIVRVISYGGFTGWFPGTKLHFNDNLHYGTLFQIDPVYNNDPRTSVVQTPVPGHTPMPASQVQGYVTTHAGARPADRDSVDQRIINDVINGTGVLIDSQSQVGGWPNLAQNTRAFHAPSNPHGDDDNDGYTNIEESLHAFAAAVE